MAIDLAAEGRSLLMLGRPGVGKTTAIRELSRLVHSTFFSCFGMHAYLSRTANHIMHWSDRPHLHRPLATQMHQSLGVLTIAVHQPSACLDDACDVCLGSAGCWQMTWASGS